MNQEELTRLSILEMKKAVEDAAKPKTEKPKRVRKTKQSSVQGAPDTEE